MGTRKPDPNALFYAAQAGDIERIRATWSCASHDALTQALDTCAYKGLLEAVELLAPRCKPHAVARALQSAATTGNVDCLSYLLTRDPSPQESACALLAALRGEHEDCIRLLLPVSDLHELVQLAVWDRVVQVDRLAEYFSPGQLHAMVSAQFEPALIPRIQARFDALQQARALDQATQGVCPQPATRVRL